MIEKKKAIRAAIYARVSTAAQDPEPQLAALREYVKQRGFVLHKEYVDRVTGDFAKRKKKSKDLAYQELMADVNKRLVDCVIVWKFDRFARSLNVLINALQDFNNLGVDFISYTQSIDTTSAMGRLFYNVIGSFAEFEREMVVERVNAGLANAKAKGVRLGRPEKDPSAGKRILALRQQGLSMRQIAEKENLSAPGVLKILRRHNSGKSDRKPEAEPTLPPAPAPEPATKITPAVDIVPETNIMLADKHPPKDNSIAAEICQLKIFLLIVKPQVWRRVLVPSHITLAKLSDVIQKLFGWTDLYPYEFVPSNADGCGFQLNCDENTFRLCDLGLKPGDGMLYEYGSLEWTHEVTFEKTVQFDDKQEYPVCIAGAMAAPPDEHCDGAIQYMETKKTRTGRKFNNMAKKPGLKIYCIDEWFLNFGPHRFDLDEINNRLGVAWSQKNKYTEPLETNERKTTPKPSIPELYQFKITILEVSPLIWRRVQIKSDFTLADLSDVIVAAFDWSGDHLHKFIWSSSWGDELAESKQLCALGLRPNNSILYEYDFGDLWEHEITFEKAVRFDKNRNYPTCTAGQNAGPPEDCGGPCAYMNARNFLSRRKGKKARAPRGRVSAFEKEFYKENCRSFDPDKFDRAEVNQQLAELFKSKS